MRLPVVAFALVLLVACGAPSAPSTPRDSLGRAEIVLDESDDLRPVGLVTGGTVMVRLPSDRGGGLAWRIGEPTFDPNVVRLLGVTFVPGSGGTGIEEWRFQAAGEGSATVHLDYGPADDPTTVLKQFSFIVSVT